MRHPAAAGAAAAPSSSAIVVASNGSGETVVVSESSVVRLDHVVSGYITSIDNGIDQAKDEVLKRAVDLKQKVCR